MKSHKTSKVKKVSKARPWTTPEERLLAKLYPKHTAAECAKILGRSQNAIRIRAMKLGFRRMPSAESFVEARWQGQILRHTLSGWEAITGVPYRLSYLRIFRGWRPDRAVTTTSRSWRASG